MAEGLKVRLVRCPKCENLLPELPVYSVYQCGACGALLRAKEKLAVNGKDGEGFEKLESSPERKNGDYLEITSANDKESNGDFLNKRKDGIFKQRDHILFSNVKEEGLGYNGKYRLPLKQPIGSFVDLNNDQMNMNRSKSVHSNKGKISDQFEDSADFLRSKATIGNLDFDVDSNRMANNRSRFLNFAYPGSFAGFNNDQMISMNRSESAHSNKETFSAQFEESAGFLRSKATIGNWDSVVDSNRMANNRSRFSNFAYPGSFVSLNHDQMNMNRSKSVHSNKGKLSAPLEESAEFSDVDSNRMVDVRSRFSNFSYPGDDANGNRFAHLEQDRAELLRKLDELKEQICRTGSVKHVQRPPGYFPEPCTSEFPLFQPVRSHDYLHGDYIGFNRDQFVSFRQRSLGHRPACSCAYCCNINQHNWSTLPAKDAKSGSRWPSDYVDSSIGMFRQGKAAVARRNTRIRLPFMGGLPFILCYSCFEVLKLPRKVKLREKNQQKLQCGACSTVLSLETKSKKLIISIANTSKQVPFSDEETEFSGNFENAEVKGNELSEDQRRNSIKYETMQELAIQSYDSSEGEEGNGINVQSDSSYVFDLPTEDNRASSDLEEDRNESNTADELLHMNTSERNQAKNVSSETEIEVSSNEFDISQDSMEVSKNKESESFLVGLLKRSFRGEKPVVFVNGQPIPDHIVKKVEDLAGPIQPGDYWYDFQAGFWGVIGHPCLGIIPSFIKEFNYPMPRSCAAGNTGVFVNGRELHQKDLELLATRGLPTTKEKFYIIDISGRVYDKDSGIELTSLGKLAPTVQKLKRGFGMKVPRTL